MKYEIKKHEDRCTAILRSQSYKTKQVSVYYECYVNFVIVMLIKNNFTQIRQPFKQFYIRLHFTLSMFMFFSLHFANIYGTEYPKCTLIL